MRSRLAGALGALVSVAAMLAAAAPAVANGPRVGLQFLGQAIVPTGTTFEGTTVGGLSSIAYDSRHDVFYAVSGDEPWTDALRLGTQAQASTQSGGQRSQNANMARASALRSILHACRDFRAVRGFAFDA